MKKTKSLEAIASSFNDQNFPDIAQEENSNTSQSVSGLAFVDIEKAYDIKPYQFENDDFSKVRLEKPQGLITQLFASNEFKKYPMVCELENVLVPAFIEKLKQYGQVFYVFSSISYKEKSPNSLILKVIHEDQSKNLWVYIPGIGTFDKKFYSVQNLSQKNDVLDIAEECIVYYDVGNQEIVHFLNKNVVNFKVEYIPTRESFVEMIISTMQGLSTQRVKFDFNYNSQDLDLHYGKGFSSFHEKLTTRMLNKDKGIVMFHGPPGNGKTHYIRRLLPILNGGGKRVILIPKHILGSLESPVFNQFMLQNFVGQKIVFVMEDSESIIVKRSSDGGNRSELVSTLLNITDGLLNDVFNIQVIVTFNTALKEIDEALLRTGRLLAKHEFTNLNKEQSDELASHLGVKILDSKDSYSLADIYGYLDTPEDNEILINQNFETKNQPLGF
jgi:hypothetical protein